MYNGDMSTYYAEKFYTIRRRRHERRLPACASDTTTKPTETSAGSECSRCRLSGWQCWTSRHT